MIDLNLYFTILRRWWWLAMLPALVIGVIGLATYRPPAVSYSAAVRFTASLPPAAGSPSGFDPAYYSWLTSEYIVGGFSDWMKTGNFAQAISDELAANGKEIPAAAVRGALASDYVRSQLVLYVNGNSADEAQAIAEAAIVVLQTRNAAAFPQLGGVNAVVTALDAPVASAASPGFRAMLDLPVRLLLGLAVGVALAFAAHYFDPFVRHRKDIEAAGLEVLGLIPKR